MNLQTVIGDPESAVDRIAELEGCLRECLDAYGKDEHEKLHAAMTKAITLLNQSQ